MPKASDIEADIRLQFSPIPVISETEKVQKIIQRAVKYYSDNFSTVVMNTWETPSDGQALTLPNYVDTVYKVYDIRQDVAFVGKMNMFPYFYSHFSPSSRRKLLSFQEMIALYTFYQNAKDLFWAADNWMWVKPKLFLQGYINKYVTIRFKYKFDENDTDFEYEDYPYNWIFRYTLALTKISEGEIIRKSRAVEMDSDGQEMIDDGNAEKEGLEKELKGRSTLFLIRSN